MSHTDLMVSGQFWVADKCTRERGTDSAELAERRRYVVSLFFSFLKIHLKFQRQCLYAWNDRVIEWPGVTAQLDDGICRDFDEILEWAIELDPNWREYDALANRRW